jgi:hypothetical protein
LSNRTGHVEQVGGYVFIQPSALDALFKKHNFNPGDEWYDVTNALFKKKKKLSSKFPDIQEKLIPKIKNIFDKVKKKYADMTWDKKDLLSNQLKRLGIESGSAKLGLHCSILEEKKIHIQSKAVKATTAGVLNGIRDVLLKYFEPHYLQQRIKAGDEHILSEPYIGLFLCKLNNGKIRIGSLPGARQDQLFIEDVGTGEVSTLNRYTKVFFDFLLLSSDLMSTANKCSNKPNKPALEVATGKSHSVEGEASHALKVLGLPAHATWHDVEKAARQLTLKYHPDRPSGNAEKMLEINNARDVLEKQLSK